MKHARTLVLGVLCVAGVAALARGVGNVLPDWMAQTTGPWGRWLMGWMVLVGSLAVLGLLYSLGATVELLVDEVRSRKGLDDDENPYV